MNHSRSLAVTSLSSSVTTRPLVCNPARGGRSGRTRVQFCVVVDQESLLDAVVESRSTPGQPLRHAYAARGAAPLCGAGKWSELAPEREVTCPKCRRQTAMALPEKSTVIRKGLTLWGEINSDKTDAGIEEVLGQSPFEVSRPERGFHGAPVRLLQNRRISFLPDSSF